MLGHEDVEEPHDAGVPPLAAVVGDDGEHLAVAHPHGAGLRVALPTTYPASSPASSPVPYVAIDAQSSRPSCGEESSSSASKASYACARRLFR
jgi:hypothetical protein